MSIDAWKIDTMRMGVRGPSTAGARLALTPAFLLYQRAAIRAVTHTISEALAAPAARITAACLGLGVLAGLISLRAHHASTDQTVAVPEYSEDEVRTVAAPEAVGATGATLMDDIMLAALIVGLVACAAFVWLNLPQLMADG